MFPILMQTIQRSSAISFPMLGGLTIDPPAYFTLFGRPIYFYGVFIALGFILGALYCAKISPRFGLKSDDIYDFLIWLIPLSIIGARLYYVLFRLDYYLQNPEEIVAIWEGGLAIYGGIIAGILTAWVLCRHKKIPLLTLLDVVVYGLLIGQILGRWGNFMNREAFGAETGIFCRMGLIAPDGSTLYVHPTFLYESLWNLIGLALLILFERKGRRKYDGQCLLLYFFWYGAGRAWIEGLRTDSLYLGNTGIRVSQALSVALALVSLVILLVQSRKEHPAEKLYVNRVPIPAEGPAEAEQTEQTQTEPAAEQPVTPPAAEKPEEPEAAPGSEEAKEETKEETKEELHS